MNYDPARRRARYLARRDLELATMRAWYLRNCQSHIRKANLAKKARRLAAKGGV